MDATKSSIRIDPLVIKYVHDMVSYCKFEEIRLFLSGEI